MLTLVTAIGEPLLGISRPLAPPRIDMGALFRWVGALLRRVRARVPFGMESPMAKSSFTGSLKRTPRATHCRRPMIASLQPAASKFPWTFLE